MPKLLKSTDIAGYITNTASELTGLCPNTPVVCGGGDGVCAAVGTGCIKEGIAHSSIGTSYLDIYNYEKTYFLRK